MAIATNGVLRIASVGRTHVGRVRDNNEDSFLIRDDVGLVAVADGMGGYSAGEVASRLAIEATASFADMLAKRAERFASSPFELDVLDEVPLIVNYACELCRKHAFRHPETHDMGTTLLVAYVTCSRFSVLHIGDSRAYLWRDGRLEPITDDHSYVFENFVSTGQLTREQARTHPNSNIITRYVGPGLYPPIPDYYEYDALVGDRLLLCTDGLTDMVPEREIERLFAQHADREELADALLVAALQAGGRDNITLVVTDFLQ